jgi:hypothetical protein
MLLGRPWLRNVEVLPDWGNNIITIQGIGIIRTILVTKKLRTPTKQPKVLVCYDYHFGISNEEKDLMFAIELRLFSIGTIVVPTLVRLEQPINLIPSIGLNLVEHVFAFIELGFVFVELVFVLHVLSKILIEPIFVQPV